MIRIQVKLDSIISITDFNSVQIITQTGNDKNSRNSREHITMTTIKINKTI